MEIRSRLLSNACYDSLMQKPIPWKIAVRVVVPGVAFVVATVGPDNVLYACLMFSAIGGA